MTLEIKHIDLISGEYIPNPFPNQRTEQPHWIEKLENSLLESFCPDISLSVGHLDDFYVQTDDPDRIAQAEKILANHPEGHKLILANGDRFFYAPAEYEPIINEILAGLDVENPDLKNRGAYSSLLTSDQKSNSYCKATILIVDDETGENGGILDEEDAWRLTGDCHGKMSPLFAQEVFDTNNKAIQFRIGLVKDKFIGKGTLTPRWLDGDKHEHFRPLKFKNPDNVPQIDLVLPISSFKGTAKGNIKPGLIATEIVITEKDRSREQGERGSFISASQPVQYYTEALKDATPLLQERLEKLSKAIKDPRKLEELYTQATLSDEESDELDSPQFQDLIAELIKNDEHGQLRETEFFKKKLEQFQSKQWTQSAIGKFVKFNRAVVIPSKDLGLGELYWNNYKGDESVIGFRAPMIGKNGLRISTNKPVEEGLAPDGTPLLGVLVINDVSWTRLHQQLSTQLKAAIITHPDLQSELQLVLEQLPTAKELKDSSGRERVSLIDSINEKIKPFIDKGLALTEFPYETDNEADGMDFDGDTYGFELIHNYPNLAKAAREHSLNPDTPIKKEDKLSFDPSWSMERIALFMANSPVGVINNQVTTIQSFKNELQSLRDYGNPQKQIEYAQKLVNTANKQIRREKRKKNPRPIPEVYRKQIDEIDQIAKKPLTVESAAKIFALQEQIYDELLIEAQYNNQIAVDMFKSARAPSLDRIRQDKGALHRKLETITDKKQQGLYVGDRTLKASGVTPVELMAHLTNAAYRSQALESRPLHQFRAFFPDDYTEQQLLEVTEEKLKFDHLWNRAQTLRREKDTEPGPLLNFTTQNGDRIRLTNIVKFDTISHFAPLKEHKLNVSFKINNDPNTQKTHQLLATTTINGEKCVLGTLKESDREKLKIKPNTSIKGAGKLGQALSEDEIKLLFDQAFEGARTWKESLPPEQIEQYFGATGHLVTRENKEPNPTTNTTQNFLFAAFASEIVNRSKTFQFTEFSVGNLTQYNRVPPQLYREGELQLKVSPITNKTEAGDIIERQWSVYNPTDEQWYSFGLSSEKGAQLPLGTTVRGTLTGNNPTTATLDITTPTIRNKLKPFLDGGGQIIFGQIDKYAAAGEFFRGQTQTFKLKHFTPKTEYIISLDNKTLGIVAPASWDKIAKTKSFNATLTTLGSEKGRYAIATLDNGDKIKINKIAFRGHDDFKQESFINERVHLKIAVSNAKEVLGVETLIDGKPQIIGVIGDHHKQKPGRLALLKTKLPLDGLTFDATITSNLTLGLIKIKPETIEYPKTGEWVKTSQLLPDGQKQSLNKDAAYYLNQLSTHPTLLSSSPEKWQLPDGKEVNLPTFKITVDIRSASAVEKYLTVNKVPFAITASSQEKKRSLITLNIVEGDLLSKIRNNLEEKFGKVLNGDESKQKLSEILPFSKKVRSIFRKREELKPYLNVNPLLVPLRDLPVLLSTEDYDWPINNDYVTHPTWRITVDSTKKETVTGWLDDNKIPYSMATDPFDSEAEDQLGYELIRFKESDLNESLKKQLTNRFGTVLEGNRGGNYLEVLEAISLGKPSTIEPLNEDNKNMNQDNSNSNNKPQSEPSTDSNSPPPDNNINQEKSPINYKAQVIISSDSKDPLLAALTNPTEAAHHKGNIKSHYPVSFRNNPKREAISKNHPDYNNYKAEKYFSQKADGVPFISAEDAYKYYSKSLNTHEEKEALMTEIIAAKLTQYPKLTVEIHKRGGVEYLERGVYQTKGNSKEWEGVGRESAFIRALIGGYEKAIAQKETFFDERLQLKKPDNPGILVPPGKSDNVEKNRVKDREMATVATQFIGFPVDKTMDTSTKDYQAAWNLFDRANTGKYTANDIIMVSGNVPRKDKITDTQIEQTFNDKYKPLLDKAIAVDAQFVVGDAKDTDQLIQAYLTENGYELKPNERGYMEAIKPLQLDKSVERPKNNEIETEPLITTVESVPSPALVDYIELMPILDVKEYDKYSASLTDTDLEWILDIAGNNQSWLDKFSEIRESGEEHSLRELAEFALESDCYEDLVNSVKDYQGIVSQYYALHNYLQVKADHLSSVDPDLAPIIEGQSILLQKYGSDPTTEISSNFSKLFKAEENFEPLRNKIDSLSKQLNEGLSQEIKAYEKELLIDVKSAVFNFLKVPKELDRVSDIYQNILQQTEPSMQDYWKEKEKEETINEPHINADNITVEATPTPPITLYTDGSSLGNPGSGGWAYVICDHEGQRTANSGAVTDTTNNRMELTAVIEGIKTVKETYKDISDIHVVSDSQYVLKSINGEWKNKKNTDLWDEFNKISQNLNLTTEWVKGHNGHELNELCDRLANSAAKELQKTQRIPESNKDIITVEAQRVTEPNKDITPDKSAQEVRVNVLSNGDKDQTQSDDKPTIILEPLKITPSNVVEQQTKEDSVAVKSVVESDTPTEQITLYTYGTVDENNKFGGLAFVLESPEFREEWAIGTIDQTEDYVKLRAIVSGLEKLKGLKYDHHNPQKIDVKIVSDSTSILNNITGKPQNTEDKEFKNLISDFQKVSNYFNITPQLLTSPEGNISATYVKNTAHQKMNSKWLRKLNGKDNTHQEQTNSITPPNDTTPSPNNDEAQDIRPSSKELEVSLNAFIRDEQHKNDIIPLNGKTIASNTSNKATEPFKKPSAEDLIDTHLDKQYMPENISIQQVRTSQVAPVLMALLSAKKITHSPEYFYNPEANRVQFVGEKNTITFDGSYLKMIDNETGLERMVASRTQNDITGDMDWIAHPLPHKGEGLTDSHVKHYNNPETKNLIKTVIFEATQQQQQQLEQALPQKQLVSVNSNGNGHVRRRGR
ncbi:ribonuclease H (plasmid) [Gloeothece citriformis PCC 7424]|uniref:ribonuclease H n=1 Tax=Gloeothece citriformis (strain PCC 7424) TaxID=65393 RepID=B7KMH6_GLOC7|nr:ribonuclease H [Gloeothece citriformis]ACK73998.1 ribonuclease H [Gloeothece citriformis PCC 7424]